MNATPPVISIEVRTADGTLPLTHATIGTGIPIVLLHGWGASSALMWPLAERLAKLGFRAYVPDLPGFGSSPPPPGTWSIYDYAQCVIDYLNAQGLQRPHIIGHSFGGRIGIILASAMADQVDKLVLIDSAGVPAHRSPLAQARQAVYKALRSSLEAVGARPLAVRLRAWYGARYGSADFQAVTGVMRETFIKVVNEDLRPVASRITRPTLLLWGDQDEDTPLWQGKVLEDLIPDAGLVVFPGAGHYSYLERLQEATRVIDYFFKH